MDEKKVPYLTGGILFSLLLQARKPREIIRDKNNYGSDGLRDMDIMIAWVETLTGETFRSVTEPVIKKETTNYKSCKSNGKTYIPFSTNEFIDYFNTAIDKRDPNLLKRMIDFINWYISEMKTLRFVKAVFETILEDKDIPVDTVFTVSLDNTSTKENLTAVDTVELPVFLLSVFRFIVNERKDNTQGCETFLAWHKQAGTRSQWKFVSPIGSGITRGIAVKSTCSVAVEKNQGNQNSKHPELPEAYPQTIIPYSTEDQILLKEFTSDYDEIIKTLMNENYAESLCDNTLQARIQLLYKSKWKEKADSFQNLTLKSYVFGLLGVLSTLSDSFSSDSSENYPIRRSRETIRNLYVKLHPESYGIDIPNDVLIDDWNDGEY